MDTTHFIIEFFFRILRILVHLKFPSNSQDLTTPQTAFLFKTTLHKRSENSSFTRNLVIAETKRRGQGGVMWTEDHKRSDANHITWINLIQSNTTHCAKLGLIRAQECYIDTYTAQVTTSGLLGGFFFRGFEKLKGGDSLIHSEVQRKEHSKKEFGKKNSEKKF